MADNNLTSSSRRLRKMTSDYQPTTFTFHVSSRSLFIGTARVYRVALGVTATANNQTSEYPWVIALSQTKLRAFFQQCRAMMSCSITPECLESFESDGDPRKQREHAFFLALHEIITTHSHLELKFIADASRTEVQVEREAIDQFLTDCWQALEIVIPSLIPECHSEQVMALSSLLRDLLAFPDEILRANYTFANAIMSLQDVHSVLPSSNESICSICLEPLLSQEAVALTEPPSPSANTIADPNCHYTVRLPCYHTFHENCAMAWLCQSPTCPTCRSRVGSP